MEIIRYFAGVDTCRILDETTILNFRRLLEQYELPKRLLAEVNCHLEEKSLFCKQGTIMEASIICAPSLTKNGENKRDPEMSSTKKITNGTLA